MTGGTTIEWNARGLGEDPSDYCECGFYCPNGWDPDHLARHREWLTVAYPKKDPRLAAGDLIVRYRSPRWQHKLVYARAIWFRREFHYDFVQWSPTGKDLEDDEHDRDHQAIVLVEDSRPLGVAAFCYTFWDDAPACWCLRFIWVAPSARRQGLVSRRWSQWRKTYGAFHIEHPWSEAMEAFIRKHEPAHEDLVKLASLKEPEAN
jgi:GNAT superfamily N-acetyltransferase